MNNIHGQIIALFKNLNFEEPANIYGSISILHLPNPGMTELFRVQLRNLWFTEKTYYYLNNIVSFLKLNEETRLVSRDLPNKELEELILDIISKESLRCRYLNIDDVFLGRQENLLQCTSKESPKELAVDFFQEIKNTLNDKQSNWLNIVPLMNLNINSFELEEDGISIVKRGDEDFWNNLSSECKTGIDFNIHKLSLDKNHVSIYNNIAIVCKSYGSLSYTKLDSEFKIKKFLSILFSFLLIERESRLSKSMYKEEASCFQLPYNTVSNSITFSYFTNILPHYTSNFTIDDTYIQRTKDYYDVLMSKNDILQKRVSTSANYINKAMNANTDTDSFINYYISLDALFGVEGSVENSIKLGIEFITDDIELHEKAKYFYKLRNELVHGGSRFIEEWELFEEYYNKFKTDILTDMENLSFLCLNKYPFRIEDNFFVK